MSLSKLDKLFQPFVDSLGEFYELQKKNLLTTGIKVEISQFCTGSLLKTAMGGLIVMVL